MSKRTSEGERRAVLMLAEQQAAIDVAAVRIEQIRDTAGRLVQDCTRILDAPPFACRMVRGSTEPPA